MTGSFAPGMAYEGTLIFDNHVSDLPNALPEDGECGLMSFRSGISLFDQNHARGTVLGGNTFEDVDQPLLNQGTNTVELP